jgi:hypothetical protein
MQAVQVETRRQHAADKAALEAQAAAEGRELRAQISAQEESLKRTSAEAREALNARIEVRLSVCSQVVFAC